MNRKTEKAKLKRLRDIRKTKCPHCGFVGISRKEKTEHIRLVHFKAKPVAKIRPAAELYQD